MDLRLFVDIKKKLADVYYDPKAEGAILDAMPTDKEFDETMKIFSTLCKKDEAIKGLINDYDIVALYKYLDAYCSAYCCKYGQYGELLREICKSSNCTSIEVWFHSLYESVMSVDMNDPNFDTTNSDFCGKVNLILDFYSSILNHDFRKVFKYDNDCECLNNVLLLFSKLINKEKCKVRTKY